MNDFLSSSVGAEYNADRLGKIKVLLLGPPGCGKTCLAHLLAQGSPLAHSRPTVGCNVTLTVMQYPPGRNPALAGQEFFLELWDVGGDPRYEAMRGLYYQGINGVILVHDLTLSRSLPSLQRWVSEVVSQGTFAAPYSEDRLALSFGGMPVPCLVVGNKADCQPNYRARQAGSGGRCWGEQLWSSLLRPLARLRDWLPFGATAGGPSDDGMQRQGSSSSTRSRGSSCNFGGLGHPKESLLHGNLQASAACGDLDMHAVNSFFCELIERRYCPSMGADMSSLDPSSCSSTLSPMSARLSSERLPPVMYNAISEESSPYSSMACTPYSSTANLAQLRHCGGAGLELLRQGSAHGSTCGNCSGHGLGLSRHGSGTGWLPNGASAPAALPFPGCNAAIKLGGGGAGARGQSRLAVEGGKLGPLANSSGCAVSQAASILTALNEQVVLSGGGCIGRIDDVC